MFPITLRSSCPPQATARPGAKPQVVWGGVRAAALGHAGRIAAGLALVTVVAGLGGLYEYRHLSKDLRQPLLASVAPGTGAAGLSLAVTDAAHHLHTLRDRREFALLQQLLAATRRAGALQTQLMSRLKQEQAQLEQEVHSEQLMLVTEEAYLRSHQPVPARLSDDVAREQLRRQELRQRKRRADETAWLQLLQERLEARVLTQQLRTDLGLAVPVAQP